MGEASVRQPQPFADSMTISPELAPPPSPPAREEAAFGRAGAPLVATRLQPPPLPATYVPRGRVDRLLDAGATESCQLTLVSAPPGYGKSMAVRGWLAHDPRPHAWLTLDPGDDDPARFARYLIAALAGVRPCVGSRTSALFGVAGLPPAEAVAATLLDEVAEGDDPFVLILDDFHLLGSSAGRDLAARLVSAAPPFIQIVVVTREDPRLPLARLRAHGRLVEIRASELRHTVAETAALMAALGVELRPASVEALAERTEGWAAGLQLAALTLKDRPDPDALVAGFGGSHRYVIDYLADETLAALSPALRSFLERTSVADRLCAGLAEALTGEPGGDRRIREIEERNLFLVPLDAECIWFRYHRLFADYLRSRLDGTERRDLLLRAADWCAAHDLALEATGYALESERWPEALPFVEAGSRAALQAGEPDAVLRWTAAVPPELLASSTGLLADRAWAAFLTGRLTDASAASRRLAAIGEDRGMSGASEGRALGARAWVAVLESRPEEGERLARLAIDSLGDDPTFRGLALLALSDACWDLGRTEENAAAVAEALRLARSGPPTIATYVTGYTFALGASEQGRRSEAERVSRELLASAADASGRVPPIAGPVRVGLGMVAYEANDLAAAAAELEAGFAACRMLGMDALLGAEARRARVMTRLATAGPEAAGRAAEEGLRRGSQRQSDVRWPSAEALAAYVAFRAGDRAAALRWAERVLADAGRTRTSPPNVRLYRDLTLARILLQSGDPQRAEPVALEAGAYAVWAGTVLGQIHAAMLAACAAEMQGRRAEARSRLATAIALAAAGGYVRRIVEDGVPVAHLLPTVRAGSEQFVDAVTAGLAAEEVRLEPGRSPAGTAWRAEDGALLELLTGRELEVLRLLARGRSNPAIGEALGVTAGTAKWHVANVLGKLGASSRTEAAARARDLGLV